MFPLHSLRAHMLETFGFDGFFPTWLNGEQTAIALLFPKSAFRVSEHLNLVGYIVTKIQSYGWHCETMTWYDENTYILNDKTYILGPHVEFIVHPAVIAEKPCVPPALTSWSVVHLACDDMNMSDYNTFNIHLYKAAFPTEYQIILNNMKERANTMIKDLTS